MKINFKEFKVYTNLVKSDSQLINIVTELADFYNSFGFDSVPTKQNDGFTEQDLIDYVLENLITK